MIIDRANFIANFNDGKGVSNVRGVKEMSISHAVCGGPSVEPSVKVHVIMLSIIEDYPRRTSRPNKFDKRGGEMSIFTFSLIGQNVGYNCDFGFFKPYRTKEIDSV